MFHIIISRGAKLDSLREESQLTLFHYSFFLTVCSGGQSNFCTLSHWQVQLGS